MLIFGPVIHEEQQGGRGHAFDKAIEQSLGFGIDPVQIFEGQAKRLDLALLEQEVLECVKRPLTARRGIEGEPQWIFDRYVQQRQKGREARLKCPVKRQNLACDLLSNLARLVARIDLEVALEEVDHRQQHIGLAVGGGAPFEDEPALSPMRK